MSWGIIWALTKMKSRCEDCDGKAWANERPGADAGWRVLFAFGSPRPRAAQAETLGLKHHENDADLRHLFTIAGRVRFSFQAGRRLEIQIKPEGIQGERFAKEGEFELITSVSAYGDILSDAKQIPGQTNVFLIREEVSAGDLRGAHAHTDYFLFLYPNRQRGSARPHPRSDSNCTLALKPRGAWCDWIAPKYSQESGDSLDLLVGTKKGQLVPLTEAPLARIRYRLTASPD